jgi:tetratricopeptide (TPR) repeat protein
MSLRIPVGPALLGIPTLLVLAVSAAGYQTEDRGQIGNQSIEVLHFAASQWHLSAEACADPAQAKTHWKKAVELWKALLQKNPPSHFAATATVGLGIGLEHAEGPAQAMAFYHKTLSEQPNAFPAESRIRYSGLLLQRFKMKGQRADVDEVIRLLTNLAFPKQQPLIYFLRAEALANRENYLAAAGEYQRLADGFAQDILVPQSLYEMGRCFLLAEKPERAEEAFRSFLHKSVRRARPPWREPGLKRAVRFGLANALFAQEQFAQAEVLYGSLSGEGDFAQKDFALMRRSECLAALQKWSEAARLAESLIDNPELGQRARNLAARWWLEDKNPDKTRAILAKGRRRPSQLTPDEKKLDLAARIQVAENLFLGQHWEEAAREFQAIAQQSDSEQIKESAQRHAGLCFFRLGRWSQATTALTEQVRIAPRGKLAPHSLFLIGLSECRLAENCSAEEARDHASKGRVAFEDAVSGARAAGYAALVLTILIQAAAVLEKQGHADLAEIYHEKTLEEKTATPAQRLDAREALARLCLRHGKQRYGKAIEHLNAMLPNCDEPRAERLRFVLGQCHLAINQVREALECFKKGVDAGQTPDMVAKSLYEMGRCRERLDDHDKALDVWYDLITRFPNHEHVREVEHKLDDGLKRRLNRIGN